MRSWTSGHDHINTESATKLIMEHLGKEDAQKSIEGVVSLVGQVAYEQGIRHGKRARPSFDAVKQAHHDGFDEGWNAAMQLRDDTENWNDDQSYGYEQ